ncbi:polyprenyl synthetase family protein [Thermomonas flagellata]|uniref:polyprenyl synthetase family protein n=1 Tax=Thermomonas flagellata TaxID=2888524 RepID=UPI001F04B9E0|nr:farnesyl diphosphate synthase [Thermomonas flagellata]
MPDSEARLAGWRARVEASLDAALPRPEASPARLHAAMRHGVQGGGKRIRPLLVYATGTALGADEPTLDAAAAAVELVHCYSLIHDDLPAMDDDVLRRGQPTVHVAFDEATAILAGDALQALAFELLAGAALPAERRVAMLAELAHAAGAAGMCGGQALDMQASGQQLELAALEILHARKTGALLRAAVRLGALAAGADAGTRAALDRYADALGLAFQIRDDLLDVEGDPAVLGKTAGKDAAQAKATFPGLLGRDASRARLATLAVQMQEALQALPGEHGALAALARQVVERDR